ncbi:MAG: hypothetical protein H6672_20900 [Anaerolineaceae bacterium]|nr:hypothetical protein [Anaerolineaceae bacterium]
MVEQATTVSSMIEIDSREEDQLKTKSQLIDELNALRHRFADLQAQTHRVVSDPPKYATAEYQVIQSKLWEERFRALTENIEDVFWVISPGRNELIYVSPAYTTIWQRPLPPLQSLFLM